MVTILSAGGGCGATTFAINLATELHAISNHPTLLVDMDCNYGAAAGYLGASAQYSIADVLSDGDRIDAQLIRTTAVQHSPHIHLMASPATVDMENPAPMAYQHLGRMVQRGREAYADAVFDAPRVPLPVAALLANASRMTYIMLQMNVENIRVARAMCGALIARGVPQDRIMPLVNRYRGRREMISMEDAKRAIGCDNIGYLSNDYKGVISSINFGKPLSSAAPRSPLRADIQNLARALQQATTGRSLVGAGR
jgi:pilus assembly protein CpaE